MCFALFWGHITAAMFDHSTPHPSKVVCSRSSSFLLSLIVKLFCSGWSLIICIFFSLSLTLIIVSQYQTFYWMAQGLMLTHLYVCCTGAEGPRWRSLVMGFSCTSPFSLLLGCSHRWLVCTLLSIFGFLLPWWTEAPNALECVLILSLNCNILALVWHCHSI